MENKFLTSEEIIAQANTFGLDLSDRKLKYYVTLSLVPKPVRNPDGGSDGRVAYYHVSIIDRLSKIKELQDSGFTLPQIKKYLENSIDDRLESLLAISEKETEPKFSVEKVISALSGEAVHNAFTRFQKQISADPSNQELIKSAGKEYYIELISLMMGRERADEYVKHFFNTIPNDELIRKTELLKQRAEGQISPGKSSSLSVIVSSLCEKLRSGNFNEDKVLDELKDLADKIYILQDKYRVTYAPLKDFFDVSKFMRQPFWLYFKSLLEIESFVKDKEPGHLDRAVVMSVRSDEMLDSIEELVQQTKRLLELYKNSEKI